MDRQNERRDQVPKPENGTTEWIWTHPDYLKWCDKPAGILWVEGKPGSGKSVIAKSILESLRVLSSTEATIICDWFYSTRGGDLLMAHISLMKSLLYQVLSQSRSLFRYFRQIYRNCPPSSMEWVTVEHLQSMLSQVAATGQPTLCVIDAMDESEEKDRAATHRRRLLQHFSDLTSSAASRIKFIILSRPTSDIEQEFWKQKVHLKIEHIVVETENTGDIKLIVESGLKRLREALQPLPKLGPDSGSQREARLVLQQESDDEFCEEVRNYLTNHAQGVVLWVSVVLESLLDVLEFSVYSRKELLEKMQAMPQDMDRLYTHIIEGIIARLDDKGLEKARKVLVWVSGANTMGELQLQELHEAIAIPTDIPSALDYAKKSDPITYNHLQLPIANWFEFRLILRKLCGPLVEVISTRGEAIQGEDRVQILHRTAQDFLHVQGPKAIEHFSFTQDEAIATVRKDIDRYLEIAFPEPDKTSYFPMKREPESLTDMYSDMAIYLNRRVLCHFIMRYLDLKLESGKLESKLQRAAELGRFTPSGPWHFKVHHIPLFSQWFKGSCSQRTVFDTLCLEVACSRGLVNTAWMTTWGRQHHFRNGGRWSTTQQPYQSWKEDQVCFRYQASHIILLMALRHKPGRLSSYVIHTALRKIRHQPKRPPHFLWKVSPHLIQDKYIIISPLEFAALQSGNEESLRTIIDITDSLPWYEDLSADGDAGLCRSCDHDHWETLRNIKKGRGVDHVSDSYGFA